MTKEIKTAIDDKITTLGFYGCLDFLIKTQINVYATDNINENNYRSITRSELAAENWADLNELFLNWQLI